VALLLDPPVAVEVEGLRRALGDTSLGAVGPHLTLVPPVNVRADEVVQAVDVIRHAAYDQSGPLQLGLGPVASFFPTSPVVYLALSGPSLGDLARLRRAVLAGPLLRPARWPWVPHVTLADSATDDRIASSLVALGSYAAELVVDRVVLMEETVTTDGTILSSGTVAAKGARRRWLPIADACLGRPAVIGRGGLELEITQGRIAGPDVLAMVEDQPEGFGEAFRSHFGPGQPCATGARRVIVLTGRRAGRVTGLATAWAEEPVGPLHVSVLVDAVVRRQGVGRALLSALEPRVQAQGWATAPARGHGLPEFFVNSSAWIREFEP
jgi:2'-5' RNA ligase/GNAT superfamily N-acetyltransferase